MGKRKEGSTDGAGVWGKLEPSQEASGPKTGCCTPHPADGRLPGGDTDSMDEARRKKSQQEAEENWGGKRGQEGGGEPGITCEIRAKRQS